MEDSNTPVDPQSTGINRLNAKLGYDFAAALQEQGLEDNQSDARAWSAHRLRVARNAESLDNFIAWQSSQSTATAEQVGQTEESQTTSPVRTATGDAIVGGVGVSAEQVAANVATLATSLVPVIATALATAISQTIAALVPTVVQAAQPTAK